MDHFQSFHMLESNQDLDRKPLNQTLLDPLKMIDLQELIKIDVQKFKHDTEMPSKGERRVHFDYVFLVLGIMEIRCSDKLYLYFSLFIKLFLVFNDF
jgi:hypothetical protein